MSGEPWRIRERDQGARERALHRFDELLAEELAAGAEKFFARLWLEPMAGGLPLIVIGQIQRCGGTLLSRLLDGHPEVRSYPLEMYWGAPTEYDWPQQALLELEPAEAFRQLAAGNAHQIRRFTTAGYHKADRGGGEDYHSFAFSLVLQRLDFLARLSASPARSRRELLDAFLASFFTAWLDHQSRYRQARLISAFAKRHNFAPAIDGLFADYPDGRLLTIVRDPASWYASASVHSRELYGDVERAIGLWCASAAASCEAQARSPERVTLLDFERLVGETEAVMRKLAELLEVRWNERLTVPSMNGRRILSNSSFKPIRGVDRATLQRAPALDPATAAYIRRYAAPLYAQCRALCL